MVSAVVLTTACDKDKDIPEMTMTTQKTGYVTISLAGSGKVTIDWGDGSKKESHMLSEFYTTWMSEHKYSHNYVRSSDRTISLIGENITHLSCVDIGLTSLDVSKIITLQVLRCLINPLKSLDVSRNTDLIELEVYDIQLKNLDVSNNLKLKLLNCSINEIESLDVSNNAELEFLFCGTNQLIDLDASKNKKLISLYCDDNQLNSLNVKGLSNLEKLQCGKHVYTLDRHNRLTSLDVSGCTSLNYLDCEQNLLSIDALNALFETLHGNAVLPYKSIVIKNNPGAKDCDTSIAEIKGWQIL